MNNNKSDNKYWIYGKHAVKAALSNPRRKLFKLLATTNSIKEFEDIASTHPALNVSIIDPKIIDKTVGGENLHQNLALEVEKLDEITLEEISSQNKKISCIIALDQLTDPHNIGAIMRSAAAFGVDAVIITSHNSPKDLATIAKISSGALEITPLIKITNLAHSLNSLKKDGYWIIGLEGTAKEQLHKVKLDGKIVLVMGSEGQGLRRLTKDTCDILAKLAISSDIESLNVSNASAISLYEFYRQNTQ